MIEARAQFVLENKYYMDQSKGYYVGLRGKCWGADEFII